MKNLKKLLAFMLVFVLTAVAVTGCAGKKAEESTSGDTAKTEETDKSASAGETKKIKIFQFKVEIADQLAAMEKEYEASHPGIDLEIETVGGGADYGAALKAKFASGEEPDIFNNGGFNERDVWMDKLEDLSDQPWVENLVAGAGEPMTKDGKIYGQPMNLEGYGFLYNKELFEKAGITEVPKSLDQLEDAAKKLEAIGVTPFSNGYQEFWILGIHNLNVALAQQEDPDAFIEGLKNGSTTFKDNAVMNDWVNLLNLTVKYGNKNPLTTDYNTQVTDFASGKAAMMQQGNWTQVQINQINKDIKVGIMPMPINNEELNKIMVGVPNNWAINNNSPVKEEAKELLNWMVSTPEGQKYIVKEFKFIPAFKNISFEAADLGDIAAGIQDYTSEGNTLGWHWFKLPDGAVQEFGNAMQAYIADYAGGKDSKDQMLESFDDIMKNLSAK